VIEDQRHAPAAPLLALAAELTPPLFDLLRVQPALERAAVVGRVLDEDLVQKTGVVTGRLPRAVIEMIRGDLSQTSPAWRHEHMFAPSQDGR